MAETNQDRIGGMLVLLKEGLAPFVEREMRAVHGERWLEQGRQTLVRDESVGDTPLDDVHALLGLVWFQWREVFRRVLGNAERAYVSELRDVRNRWAHQQVFSTNDTIRALDTAARLLRAVGAPEADRMDRLHADVQRAQLDEQARQQARRAAARPTEGMPAKDLRPWRAVVTPHPDVSSGRYHQAEFAADLQQVVDGTASPEYGEPREFFQRTFLTEGLRNLSVTALRRLAGQGGDPVVELQTNFGGGKTHAMLTVYHLLAGVPVAELTGVSELAREAGAEPPPSTRRAVLVGTALSPGQPGVKPDGTVVRTLWGELAWQLGGAAGYARVAEADRTGMNPGSDALGALFRTYGPCVVLIDEFVAYVRQMYGHEGLPGGTFDSVLTFTQALTEAARQVDHTLVVVSVPASDIETGGEGGQAALARLKNILARVEATWKPASTEEGYEIVRRRLFLPLTEAAAFRARDAVLHSFSRQYRAAAADYPPGVGEAAYLRRMEQAYPIHPALFDQLYTAWSAVDRFQRTRGVLRLMAMVVHVLWQRGDQGLLILPGMVPIDSPAVQSELTRYLEDRWTTALETDIDGPRSLPLATDDAHPALGRYSAARRVSRTIYMGTAPLMRAPHPGIDPRQVRLGCVQPGETAPVFDDALRRLAEASVHLYHDGSRYWYSTQPSVTSLAQDRAGQVEVYRVWQEVQRLLANEDRGRFAAVHVFPEGSGDIPDEPTARLVVVPPTHPHTVNEPDSAAMRVAREWLGQHGAGPRFRRNLLLFVAADAPRVGELEHAGRLYLGWQSILRDSEGLDLTPAQAAQAKAQAADWATTLGSRMRETFSWLLVPHQPDPKTAALAWETHRLTGDGGPPARASRKAVAEQILCTEYAPELLAQEVLRQYYWTHQTDVALTQLWRDLSTYLYLPRLRDEHVLASCVQSALTRLVEPDFAVADGLDGPGYVNLRFHEEGRSSLASTTRLVWAELAREQLEAATPDAPVPGAGAGGPGDLVPKPARGLGGPTPPPLPPRTAQVTGFHGAINVDPIRPGAAVDTVLQEVLVHLTSQVGAAVTVTVEIHAQFREPLPEATVRTVEENARTLKFDVAAFDRTV